MSDPTSMITTMTVEQSRYVDVAPLEKEPLVEQIEKATTAQWRAQLPPDCWELSSGAHFQILSYALADLYLERPSSGLKKVLVELLPEDVDVDAFLDGYDQLEDEVRQIEQGVAAVEENFKKQLEEVATKANAKYEEICQLSQAQQVAVIAVHQERQQQASVLNQHLETRAQNVTAAILQLQTLQLKRVCQPLPPS